MASRKSLDFNQIAARVVAQATGQKPKPSMRERVAAAKARAKEKAAKHGKAS
jgi:hypothetical protein